MKRPQLRKKIDEWLGLITKAIVIVSVPWSLYQYITTSEKEKQDRAYAVYNSLDKEYKEWEALCLHYPELDIFDVPDSIPPTLTAIQLKQETILFTILFATFERAYLLYSDGDDEIRQAQWTGWKEYIEGYCSRENFKRAWKVSGSTYDMGFQQFMSTSIEQSE